MFGAAIVNVVGFFATVAALRAAAAGSAGQFVICRRGDVDQLYLWNAGSNAADDGAAVIKPDSIPGGSPGRWLVVASIDSNSPTVGTAVLAVPWNGSTGLVRHGAGWRVIGASATAVYFARDVAQGQ